MEMSCSNAKSVEREGLSSLRERAASDSTACSSSTGQIL